MITMEQVVNDRILALKSTIDRYKADYMADHLVIAEEILAELKWLVEKHKRMNEGN